MQRAQLRYIFIGIPVLFAAGSLFHFVYELSGEALAVGLLAPANESIFEHTKLFPLPAALWYGLRYLRQRERIDADAWFTAALLSMVVCGVSVCMLHYFITGALGIYALAADIAVFLAAVALGQVAAAHCYRYGRGLDARVALALILALLFVNGVLTVAPPRLPLFLDTPTGTYGP